MRGEEYEQRVESAQLALVFMLPRKKDHTGASAEWGRSKSGTYAVTLGTRGAARALGSRGASGTREAGSTSNTRSAL